VNSPLVHSAVLLIYLFLLVAGVSIALRLESVHAGKWVRTCITAVLILLGLLIYWFSGPPQAFYDFFVGYYPAGYAVLHHKVPAVGSLTAGFVNIPIVAYVFAPFAILDPTAAAWCFTLVGIGLVAAAWWTLGTLARADEAGRWIIALMFVGNGPLINGIKFGNITCYVLVVLVTALFCVHRGRSGVAGMLFALSAVMKPPLVLFLLFFLVRRDFRGFWAFLGTCTIVAALSILIFGGPANIEWFNTCILQFRHYWLVGFMVQSVPAFIFRLSAPTSVLTDWGPHLPANGQQALANISVGFFFLLGLAALTRSEIARLSSKSEAVHTVEQQFSLLLCLSLIASPLSWAHYYAWLLVPAVLWVRWKSDSWVETLVALIATALTAPPLPWPMISSSSTVMSIYSAFFESHVLFGGVIWFFLICWKLIQPAAISLSAAEKREATI
jgi:alpha-1,2-mannosyltransferase